MNKYILLSLLLSVPALAAIIPSIPSVTGKCSAGEYLSGGNTCDALASGAHTTANDDGADTTFSTYIGTHSVDASAHHNKAVSADINHDSTTGVSADDHHTKAVSGDIDHDSITGVSTADHHVATVDTFVTGTNTHDHNGGDGAQIPTGGIVDGAVTTPKIGLSAITFSIWDTNGCSEGEVPTLTSGVWVCGAGGGGGSNDVPFAVSGSCFTIINDGAVHVGIGTNEPGAFLAQQGFMNDNSLTIQAFIADGAGMATFLIFGARGTELSSTTLQNGDFQGQIIFGSYDDTTQTVRAGPNISSFLTENADVGAGAVLQLNGSGISTGSGFGGSIELGDDRNVTINNINGSANLHLFGDGSNDTTFKISGGGGTWQQRVDSSGAWILSESGLGNDVIFLNMNAPTDSFAIGEFGGVVMASTATASGFIGSEGCFILRDSDDAGFTKLVVLNGVGTFSTDADGVCD